MRRPSRGGYYVIIDHRAAAGAGLEATCKLHRMDEAITKQKSRQRDFSWLQKAKR
jgi:predicted methyltransferase